MPITLASFEVVETVGTTEHSFTNDTTTKAVNTTPGLYQGTFDLSALVTGDIFVIRVYEKVASSGGTQRVVWKAMIAGVQAEPIYATPTLILGVGWDFTVQKIAGTDRSITGRIASVT